MYGNKSLRTPVKHWYLLLILGIIFIATGIYTFAQPAESLLAISLLFTISFLIGGLFEIIYAVSNRHHIHNWGWSLANGIITALIGVLMATSPALSLTTLMLYVAFTVLFRSFNAISTGRDLKGYGSNANFLIFAGVLGVLFSFILMWNPVFAGMSMVIWIGMALIMAGICAIYLSLQLKGLHKKFEKVSHEAKDRFDHASKEMHDALKK